MTNALIAGAGIAGPAVAMALQRVGIDAVILESRQQPADGIGSFLTVGSNGLRALRALGIDGESWGFTTPDIVLVSGTGKELGHVSITGPPEAPVSRTMRRSDLYGALRDEAARRGIDIRRGSAVSSAEDRGNDVVVGLTDGSRLVADLLVGCDGISSTVRAAIDPGGPPPRYAGLHGHGGFAPAGIVAERPGTYRMIFGRRAFFGYVVAPDGAVWWFVNEPSTNPTVRQTLRDPDALRDHLSPLVARDRGPAARLVAHSADLAPSGPIHTVPDTRDWHRGRMVVVGDAAHAPSPSSGQGASLALEDAVVLAARLRDHDDPRVAITRFVEERRPRVRSIISQAERINSTKAATGLARVARDLVLPLILRAGAGSPQLRDTYDFAVEPLEPSR